MPPPSATQTRPALASGSKSSSTHPVDRSAPPAISASSPLASVSTSMSASISASISASESAIFSLCRLHRGLSNLNISPREIARRRARQRRTQPRPGPKRNRGPIIFGPTATSQPWLVEAPAPTPERRPEHEWHHTRLLRSALSSRLVPRAVSAGGGERCQREKGATLPYLMLHPVARARLTLAHTLCYTFTRRCS